MSIISDSPQCASLLEPQIDWREALFNDGAVGPIQQVQVSTQLITRLRGILFDVDPQLYCNSAILPNIPADPREFYQSVAKLWLGHHPVLAKAEVRDSGSGLHVILRFAEPVVFASSAERDRWSGMVEVVQAALPVDPNQPGITATTRALGSTNSKNGRTVSVITAGEPVTAQEVKGLFEEMARSPFRTVMRILTGAERQQPCPICSKHDLAAFDRVGKCYGCGKASLEQLFGLVLDSHCDDMEVGADGCDQQE